MHLDKQSIISMCEVGLNCLVSLGHRWEMPYLIPPMVVTQTLTVNLLVRIDSLETDSS